MTLVSSCSSLKWSLLSLKLSFAIILWKIEMFRETKYVDVHYVYVVIRVKGSCLRADHWWNRETFCLIFSILRRIIIEILTNFIQDINITLKLWDGISLKLAPNAHYNFWIFFFYFMYCSDSFFLTQLSLTLCYFLLF